MTQLLQQLYDMSQVTILSEQQFKDDIGEVTFLQLSWVMFSIACEIIILIDIVMIFSIACAAYSTLSLLY